MSVCACEDYPCCGHDGLLPEDGRSWFEGIPPDERDEVLTIMAPCPRCGEWRPRGELKYGSGKTCCYLCERRDAEGVHTPVADNLYVLRAMGIPVPRTIETELFSESDDSVNVNKNYQGEAERCLREGECWYFDPEFCPHKNGNSTCKTVRELIACDGFLDGVDERVGWEMEL